MRALAFSLLLLSYSVAYADGGGTGLTGRYFDDVASGGHLQGTPAATRIDCNISFDFVSTPPPGLPRTTGFSVQWTGKVQPRYSENYMFMTYSDDGVRVLVNNQLLINNWTSHAGAWNWNWIQLQAGQLYDIEIDYFQGSGAAQIQLWWQSPTQTKEIIPTTQLYSRTDLLNGSTTYYISPLGNDSNSGLTVNQAWQTISHVNQQTFQPGDKILFQRAGRYPGSLQPQGSGSVGSPISISAYGTGSAPIIDGTSYEEAIKLFNQQYWSIDSLEVTGGNRFGIWVSGDVSNQILHYFRLTNLVVHDMYGSPRWDSGLVMFAPLGDHLTFDDVVIDGITAYNTNLWYGIHVGFNLWHGYPTQPPRTTNVTVRNSTVHDVYGDGITAAQAQNVLIEKNVVFNTGLAPAGISYTPNGIWTWQCDHTIVQYNEGYATHSYSYDGGVFDIDWGSTNTIIQYNYAHNAQGYCIAVMGAHNVTTTNSIVRFNICANNARNAGTAPNQGDIFITTFDGGSLDGVQIYNNTAYWNPAANAGWVRGRGVSMVGTSPRFIVNNIVYSNSPTMIDTDASIALDHNQYWLAATGTPVWKYGSIQAGSIGALRTATGQEQNGSFSDPQMNSPTYSAAGRPSVQFTLLPGSSAIGTGSAWAGMASSDFFGNAIPAAGTPDKGAYYLMANSSVPQVPSSWVNVISKNSGKCLDVTGYSTAIGAALQQWTCLNGTNQKFLFTPVQGGYEITAQNSRQQLEVQGGPTATQNGVLIVQSPFLGDSSEIWTVQPTADGFFSIVPLSSGKCMDVRGISLSNGAPIQQWTCTGGANQKWKLVPVL